MEELVMCTWDYLALGLYAGALLLVTIFSLWSSKRGNKEGYFLANRSVTWVGVGASLFASSMSVERIIFLTGGGADVGLAAAATEILAIPFLLVLGWVFAPVFITSNVFSLPQYIHRRFGGQRIRILLVLIYLLLYVGFRVSVNLYASAIFLQTIFPDWVVYPVIITMLLVVALYTVPGGVRTVIDTQIIQTFVIIAGSSVLAVYAYLEVGGYPGLKAKYFSPASIANDSFRKAGMECGYPKEKAFYMLQDQGHSDMPWASFLFGYSSNILWMWCADQLLVQKALTAKNLSHAQGGCILAGYLKILPLFLMVIPGLISRTLYADAVGCATEQQCLAVCANPSGCSHIAYPMLMMGLLPKGLHGVLFTVMLSASMADLSSVFNSAATIITIDVASGLKIRRIDRWIMATARIATMLMVVVCLAWLPAVHHGAQLSDVFAGIFRVQFGVAPPIAAVFLLALLWPRANEKGSFCALLVGLSLGVAHIVTGILYPEPACGLEDSRPAVLQKVHPFYISLIIFAVTVVVDVVVSLCTSPPNEALLIRTTFWHRDSTALAKSRKRTKKDWQTDQSDPCMFLFEEDEYEEAAGHWRRKSNMRLCYEWFCGYASYDVTPKRSQTRDDLAAAEYDAVSIQQSPRAKVFLNINLVVILLVAIALLASFSLPTQIRVS